MNFRNRHGCGGPTVSECEGEYNYEPRKNQLTWQLPLVDSSNKTGSMEFSCQGHVNDFFPINVSFYSKRPYADLTVIIGLPFSIQVIGMLMIFMTFPDQWCSTCGRRNISETCRRHRHANGKIRNSMSTFSPPDFDLPIPIDPSSPSPQH